MNSRHRKHLLMMAASLAAVYLVWLSSSLGQFLPEALSSWYVGFALLALTTGLALAALPRRGQTPAPNPQESPAQARRRPPTARATQIVFTPEDEAPTPAPQRVAAPSDFGREHPSSSSARIQSTFEPNTPLPTWQVHHTDDQLPRPQEPARAEAPARASTVDPFGPYRQQMAPLSELNPPPTPMGWGEPSKPSQAPTGWGSQPSNPSPPTALTWGAPTPAQRPSTHGDLDIQVMASFTEPSAHQDSEAAFSSTPDSSIEDAIRRYTFDLHDIPEADFSQALESINPLDSLFGTDHAAPATPRPTNAVKSRLQALRSKLNADLDPDNRVLSLAQEMTASLNAPSLPDITTSLTGGSAAPMAAELPDLFSAYGSVSAPPPQRPSFDYLSIALEPFSNGLGSLDRDDLNRLWQDYVEISKRCGRDMSKLNANSFLAQLQHNHDAICRMYQCTHVAFHVKIKNGRPALSAHPAN